MWIFLDRTQEYIPVNEMQTEKVFLDGDKGWCIKQKDGGKYYISDEQKKSLAEEMMRKHHDRPHDKDHGKGFKERIRKMIEEEEDE